MTKRCDVGSGCLNASRFSLSECVQCRRNVDSPSSSIDNFISNEKIEIVYIWANGDWCTEESLEDNLRFRSDDYAKILMNMETGAKYVPALFDTSFCGGR